MRRRGERGEGNLGCIVAVAIFAVVVIIAIKAVPAKLAVAELTDYAGELADRATTPGMTDEVIAQRLLERANKLRIPLAAENLKVTRSNVYINIEMRFDMVLKYPLYTYVWKIHKTIERPLIYT